MKSRFAVVLTLVVLFLLAVSAVWAQDWPDGPWAQRNADIYRTNVTTAPYIFGTGGVVVRKVPLPQGYLPPRWGFHSQIAFDSQGNLYWRGSTNERVPANPNASYSIYSVDANGNPRWVSDNIFGHFKAWAMPIPGIKGRVYAVGANFGKLGPGSPPVVAALNKNTGATLWSTPLPPGPTNWAPVLTLANDALYLTSEPWRKTVGEEDIMVVTGVLIDTNDGSIDFLQDYPLPLEVVTSGQPNQAFTIVPDAFPGNEPGVFFAVQPSAPGKTTITAISLATGAIKWQAKSEFAMHNHLIYSPVNRELYRVSWSDYGSTFTVYDVATGTIKGRLNARFDSVLDPLPPADGSGDPLRHEVHGHGFCDTAALLPDGKSIVTAAFSGVVVVYSSDGQGNLTSRILLSGPSHWGEMHHFAQLVAPTEAYPAGVWIATTRHNPDDPYQSDTVQVIAVDVATGRVLWQFDTGIWGPTWHNFYTWDIGARTPAAISPSGKLYYIREDGIYILEPAPAPQIDGTVILDGFVGTNKYGSGDGSWVVAPPLTLEFRQPGTTNVLFRKSIALNVHTEAGGAFKLNNIPAGTYDIAVKSYVQDRFGEHYEFSHWLRAVARDVVVSPNGTGSVVVNLHLLNADADNDNEVTLFDFGLLVQAFGALRGDANWNQAVDFDGDEEITLFDFGILVQNFGMVGED